MKRILVVSAIQLLLLGLYVCFASQSIRCTKKIQKMKNLSNNPSFEIGKSIIDYRKKYQIDPPTKKIEKKPVLTHKKK